MELAKQFIDVGIFTNQIDEMRAFYGERIRLPYEELLPVGGGVRQYAQPVGHHATQDGQMLQVLPPLNRLGPPIWPASLLGLPNISSSLRGLSLRVMS